MIEVNVYSVFDSKAGVFSAPTVYPNEQTAVRAFTTAVRSADSQMFMFPEDFTLFLVGSWNVVEGKLCGVDKVSVVNGAQLKEVK